MGFLMFIFAFVPAAILLTINYAYEKYKEDHAPARTKRPNVIPTPIPIRKRCGRCKM